MIQSVERAFSVLYSIGSADGNLSVSQLARDVDLPRTTVIRLIDTLQQVGAIEKGEGGDDYHLGGKMLTMLNRAAVEEQLDIAIQVAMQQLSLETGETIYHCAPDGHEVFYVSQIESKHAIQMKNWAGRRTPLHPIAAGKLMMSRFTDAELDLYLATHLSSHTDQTITDRKAISRELDEIRSAGYAWNRGEYEDGFSAVAAPILSKNGDLVAMLAIGIPQFRLGGLEEKYAQLVKAAADGINQRIS